MNYLFDFKYRLPRGTYFFLGASSFFVLILIWQGIASFNMVKDYFLPSPIAVGQSVIDLFIKYDFLSDCKASFYRVSIGYVLAAVLAIPIGLLIGSFNFIEALLEPVNDFIRYTPLAAFIPLIVLWFGIGDLNQITIIFFGVFWSLILMVSDSVANVPKEILETAHTLGISRARILIFVIFPQALPGIFDSLRVAIGWAWSSLILAEIVGANTGIGHMIMESQRFLRTGNVIAGIILVGILGVFLDFLFKAAYPLLFPWTEKGD